MPKKGLYKFITYYWMIIFGEKNDDIMIKKQ